VIPLDRVQDVSTRQTPFGQFLDYGSVEIDTAGAIANELFTYASHPEMLRDQVFVLSEQLRRGL
jgi:membrane protein YdbS with pleckstrin-like domain